MAAPGKRAHDELRRRTSLRLSFTSRILIFGPTNPAPTPNIASLQPLIKKIFRK
jgi:hypothetical protein